MTDQLTGTRLRLYRWKWRMGYRIHATLNRWRRAWLYARGRLDQDVAEVIIADCRPFADWLPLEGVSIDGIIENAGWRWSNSREEIEPLAQRAAYRVWDKWNSTGDIASAAEDWALNLIAEYAEDEGIELVEGEREPAEGEA